MLTSSPKLLIWLFSACFCNFMNCFNLSPKPNAIFIEPELPTSMPKQDSSYFGFSINLRPNGIIIGAPRAQSTLESQKKVYETGAIYRCTLSPALNCYPYVFDRQGNTKNGNRFTEMRDFQWLGASMDGGLNDNDTLVVCAPRFIIPVYKRSGVLPGICYLISDTRNYQPTNVKKILPTHINQKKYTNTFAESMVELGLSSHVTADNQEVLIGAPGFQYWTGSAIRYRKEKATECYNVHNQKPFSYFGYSVGSGYFDSNNSKRLMYVASAPRANSKMGEVSIFDYQGHKIEKIHTFYGKQIGEYFGYAVLAEDVNGDGLTDIVISAPLHSVSGFFDDGAINVFINKGKFNFHHILITSPIHGKARFGTTLTTLGDINHDGYNDIAVGAPFAGGGSVFIYLGSAGGLCTQHSQRLDSPIDFITSNYKSHMFGHGLSKGSDIDNNGFNDFVIGAPNAETALLYKAYPVVRVLATIKSNTREISTSQTSLPLTICYSISTTSTKIRYLELKLHVVLDHKFKRVKILSNGDTEKTFNVNASLNVQCISVDSNIQFSAQHVFRPIVLELHYSLVNTIPDSEVFCEICAALNPFEPKAVTEKIFYRTGCKTEICIADMQVKSSSLEYSYVLGSSKTFVVTYDVINTGDTAYFPQINMTSSNQMLFAKYPSNCKVIGAVMLCDLNRGLAMPNGTTDTVTVSYDVSGLSGSNMVLTAQVFSTSDQTNSKNHTVKDVVTLTEFTEVVIVGNNKMTYNITNLEDVSNQIDVVNSYEIKSNGPSNVGAMQVVFDIPVAYKIAGSSATIPILDINNITMHAVYKFLPLGIDFYQNDTQFLMKSPTFNELNEEMVYDAGLQLPIGQNRRRREAKIMAVKEEEYDRIPQYNLYDSLSQDLKGTLPITRTIVFNCNDPELTICVRAVINLSNFEPENPIRVNMNYNVNVENVDKILTKPWEYFLVLIDVDVINNSSLSSLVISKKIDPNIIIKHQTILPYDAPLWIIILTGVIGIFVLALITYVMHKFGFFKRATKEEMKRLLHHAEINKKGVEEPFDLNEQND